MPPDFSMYECPACAFTCSKSSNWIRHTATAKHQKLTNVFVEKVPIQKPEPVIESAHICSACNTQFDTKVKLTRHAKKCAPPAQPPKTIDTGVVIELIKQNQEFKTMLMEQNDKYLAQNEKIMELSSKVSVVNNITNNNQFNLNVFLNETCKDAINLQEFVDNLQIQMNELENVGKKGYVIGITDIIIDRLKQLDVSKRPVHCTDLKREIMYIKDDNSWNKDEENKKIKRMITRVANKNYRKIPEWREENPNCLDAEHMQYDFCIDLMRNSLGEIGDEQERLDEKIVKNIAKLVIVNK